MAGAIRMTRSPHHKMSLAAYMILFMTHYTSSGKGALIEQFTLEKRKH
jgi:hypothetical protein